MGDSRDIGHGGAHADDLQALMGGVRLGFRVGADGGIAQLGEEQLKQVASLPFSYLDKVRKRADL